MPNPPDIFSPIIYAVVTTTIITICSWVILRKNRHAGIIVAGMVVLSGYVLHMAIGTMLDRLYANQALPYVQESVDETCGVSKFVVAADDIYNSSGWQWRPKDSNAGCYLYGDRWECSCGR